MGKPQADLFWIKYQSMAEKYKNRLLARWLEGRLSPEEQAAFEKTTAYPDFQEIVRGMERFKKPAFDPAPLKEPLMGAADALAGPKVLRMKPWVYAAAALLLALVSLGVFFSEKQYVTGVGEQLDISLPDGSRVQLNAASRLEHRRFFTDSDKTLTLVEGEGYFEVEHGGQFRVKTPHGIVTVLGTRFNIRSRNELFELSCYEGRVKFAESTILSAGETLHLEDGRFVKERLSAQAPAWIAGISEFRNAPLSEVLQELQLQYGLSFETGAVDTSARFSGSFVHDNLPTALKSVFLPMGINYEHQAGQNSIILSPNTNAQE